MSKIVWDDINSRTYEAGVDRGVLYINYGDEYVDGVAWNGLTSVDAKSAREQVTPLYTGSDVKVDFTYGYDEYSGTIKAYTYPDEFEEMLGRTEFVPGIYGRQQGRPLFGLCYRTLIGDTADGVSHGYKLHLLYALYTTEISETRTTINETPGAYEFSFPFSSLPIEIEYGNYDPITEVIVDSRHFTPQFMEELEDILYGSEDSSPRLPFPEELIDLFYVQQEMPEEYEGYPYELFYPHIHVYPVPLLNPLITMDIDLGEQEEEKTNLITQDTFAAGTYVIRWSMASDVACVKNHLVIYDTDDQIVYSGSDVTAGEPEEYTLTVSSEQLLSIQWVEEGVFPATTLSVSVTKTN